MPAALDVDKEQVRMLALSLGVREAARKMQLNEKTVLHWSHTGDWFAHLKKPIVEPQRPLSMQPRSVCSVKPADVLTATLLEDGNETRIQGMRYAKRTVRAAAELAETNPEQALAHAANVKAALQSAALAGSWKDGSSEAAVSLQFFNISQERIEQPEHHVYDVTETDDDPMF